MKKIIAEGHRGYCARYPENTLISYRAAMQAGVDAFEFDVDDIPKDTKLKLFFMNDRQYRYYRIVSEGSNVIS